MNSKSDFIPTLLQHAINDFSFLNKYAGRWLVQGTLTAILNQYYNIATVLSFTEEELNAALSRKNQRSLEKLGLGTMTEPSFNLNTSRIYTCVHTSPKNAAQRYRYHLYYIEPTKPRRSSRSTVCADTGKDEIEDSPSTIIVATEESQPRNIRKRRRSLRSQRKMNSDPLHPPQVTRLPKAIEKHSQNVTQPKSSCPVWFESVLDYHRKVSAKLESWKPVDLSGSTSDLNTLMMALASTDAQKETKEMALKNVSPKGHDSRNSIYWYSDEAKNLFKPDVDPDTNMLQVLKDRVELFHSALHSNEKMRNLVEGNPTDEDLSSTSVRIISAKVRCIKKVTEFAIDIMGSGKIGNDFQLCCENVITWANTIGGSEYPTNSQTVRRWHAEYRTHGKILIYRHPSKNSIPLPRILVDNPEQAMSIRTFVRTNLDRLSVEKVYTYIDETIIPRIASGFIDRNQQEWNKGTGDDEIQCLTKKDLLKHYGLRNFGITTAWRWMRALGMRYDERRKNYYVDGHERDDVVVSRWIFIRKYLQREIQMHRWVQITEKEMQKLDDNLINVGYHYVHPDTGESMYEFHVDANKSFQTFSHTTDYGGNLSVRKDPNTKIIFSFGHDEAIFNQYAFSSKCWSGCDGEQPIVPKSEGAGIMYSCLQSREFGFGFRRLTVAEVTRINRLKRRGKKYLDESAARASQNGTVTKKEFTTEDNPFARSFLYGANQEGYWSYDHFIIQLEDIMDVMNVLFNPDDYEVHILVDHSCGHDRQKPDGLNVGEMNSGYGGKQRHIHDTVIVKGCLGKFESIMSVGDTQSMVFLPNDDGPFYMSENERAELKKGDLRGSKFVPIEKKALLKSLFSKDVFLDLPIYSLGHQSFRVDQAKRTLYSADEQLSAFNIHKLCEKKGIDVDAFKSINESNKSIDALTKHFISTIEGNTVRNGNQTIHIDRARNELWRRNIEISAAHVRKICIIHDMSWKRTVEVVSTVEPKIKSKAELLKELTDAGHFIPKTQRKKERLVEWASKYQIEVMKNIDKNVTESWVGKPKGKLQIAWERGLLDLFKYCIDDYSEKGKVDLLGNIIQETSLDQLLAACTDFCEEESMLQTNLKKMGAYCWHSPKFHCELAGEGIEYSWGNAKMKYRRLRVKDRNTVSKFHQRVIQCLSRDHLDLNRVRTNSRRAREYMVAYFIMSCAEEVKDKMTLSIEEMKPCAASASKIEQMKQKVRTHRAAIDFDTKFCEATVHLKME